MTASGLPFVRAKTRMDWIVVTIFLFLSSYHLVIPRGGEFRGKQIESRYRPDTSRFKPGPEVLSDPSTPPVGIT